jgi:hypothetical protein
MADMARGRVCTAVLRVVDDRIRPVCPVYVYYYCGYHCHYNTSQALIYSRDTLQERNMETVALQHVSQPYVITMLRFYRRQIRSISNI